jgi:tRNA-splicing ligase RtcB
VSQLPNKTQAWLPEPLSDEVRASVERLVRLEDVVRVALMPDVHLAESVCVGAVVATRSCLLPDAVGGDIGCGMAAVQLSAHAGAVNRRSAGRVLEALAEVVPANRRRQKQLLPDELASSKLGAPALQKVLERDGAVQFATLGSGNHFLELQADDQGWLWLMVHTGSRALGPAVRRHYLKEARSVGGGLRVLQADSSAGQAYLNDHEAAVRFADASRRRILADAAGLLGELFQAHADWDTLVSSAHNFVRREVHDGEALWVHRKGAISAGDGEPGLIPGSMGTESFLVSGRGLDAALRSSSHGAGRAMSRGAARRRIDVAKLEREMEGIWFDDRRARLLVDEAPSAYKPIATVMRVENELTRIERRLRPVLSYKGV